MPGLEIGKIFSHISCLEMMFESSHSLVTATDILVSRATMILVPFATVLVSVSSPACVFVLARIRAVLVTYFVGIFPSADNSVALAITFCSFIITLLLIYGCITVSTYSRFIQIAKYFAVQQVKQQFFSNMAKISIRLITSVCN